ncbi:MAG: hypothetical protein WBA38_11590 [Gordonia sp. (in: high G+C Gram-positive bacteria)]|uniref:hypothetical protein n=1 Tax=Gordonia sp. (in: high G+C Gram-positive bacteria) TaxID=84139 RepID=UPI003C750B54
MPSGTIPPPEPPVRPPGPPQAPIRPPIQPPIAPSRPPQANPPLAYSQPAHRPLAYSQPAVSWQHGQAHPVPTQMPAVGPVFAPSFELTNTAEQAALVRPWQVTFYGWVVIIGSVLCLLVLLPLMFTNDATLIQWWTALDSQPDITVEGLKTVRIIVIVADIFTAVIVAINLPAGIALLRGSRGAYTYFLTMLWLNIIGMILLVMFFVIAILGAGFIATNG